MELLNTISLQFIYFGAGLSVLMVIGQLYYSRQEEAAPSNPYLSLIGITAFSILTRIALYLEQFGPNSWWYFTLFAFVFASGPLLMQMARRMIDAAFDGDPPKPARNPWFRSKWYFAPLLPVLGVELHFQLQPADDKNAILKTIYTELGANSVDIGLILGILQTILCLALLTYFVYRTGKEYNLSDTTRALSIFILPLLASISLLAGYSLKILWAVHMGGWLISLTIVLSFLYMLRYPNFFQSMKREIQKERYARTQLTGLDVPRVLKQLESLMENQKLFLDPDLRLSDLADELEMSSHQLSRILNETFSQNFNAFINSYRIAEAREQLIQEPEKTVLAIAFDVGFNTKSAFNDQFSRITGMTPARFRKKQSKTKH
ncbi:MAG: helix-turn-helix domain-containing protein [Leptospiraceae bacterium]